MRLMDNLQKYRFNKQLNDEKPGWVTLRLFYIPPRYNNYTYSMYDPEQITFFAKTDARGQQVPFGIKANDRTRHVYVIGKTGMGKSTLLENMAAQDLKNGNGLAFIDPHGQTAETLLDYIPEERKDDVLYFAPFDTDNPISFNVMEDVGPDKRHLVVAGLMSVFKKIWVDAWSARMEYILSNTLLALLEYPDSTLLGVNRMLSDKDYRMRVIENITDPAVKSFWVDEFLKYNERYMQEAGDAIKNKIGQFTSNPLIRNIIGQPHTSFNIREIMDERKIMIINLSKGLVGEQNANLLGSMMTTRIYLAAMSRADLTGEQLKAMPNFYFYVDEFQSFANATFADILSEARKYKLNLTIAHQYVAQMEDEVRDAVFGNVGTIISFRVGPFDAEVLETVFTPKFLAPDIVNLGFAQIYLTLMIDGIGSPPFSAVTLPPIETPPNPVKDLVVQRSRDNFSKKREETETAIHAWHDKSFSDKPPYIPKHLREKADGGELPNTGANLKKYGSDGVAPKEEWNTSVAPGGTSAQGNGQDTQHTGSNGKGGNGRNGGGGSNDGNKQNGDHGRRPNDPRNNDGGRPMSSSGSGRKNSNDDRKTTRTDNRNGSPKTNDRGPQNGKNLDELRSVLKGISHGNEKDAAVAQEKKEEKKKHDLKGALAAALGGVAGTAVVVEKAEKAESQIVTKDIPRTQEMVHTDAAKVQKQDGQKEAPEAPIVPSEHSRDTQEEDAEHLPRKRKQKRQKKNSGENVIVPRQDHNAAQVDAKEQKEDTSRQTQQNAEIPKTSVDTQGEHAVVDTHVSGESVPSGQQGVQAGQQAASQEREEEKVQRHVKEEVASHKQSQEKPAPTEWQQKPRKEQSAPHVQEAQKMVTTEITQAKRVHTGTVDESTETAVSEQVVQEELVVTTALAQEKKQQEREVFVDQSQTAVATPTETTVTASVTSKVIASERPVFAQNNEYAQLKNKPIVDPLAPKKLERMMKVTTSDKLPLK